jgi:hypothetical protein
VDEVDQDGRGDVPFRGPGLERGDLVAVAVGQEEPGPLMTGVAAGGLIQALADGDVAAGGDIAGVPAVHRARRVLRAAGVRAHDLLRGPRPLWRDDVEDAGGLGDPLVALLLPGTQPLAERLSALRLLAVVAPACLRAHRHALAVR